MGISASRWARAVMRPAAAMLMLAAAGGAVAADLIYPWTPQQNANYVQNFHAVFGQPSSTFTGIDGYIAAWNYDRYTGAGLTSYINQMKNGNYGPFWSMDYWMDSLNIMYRATGNEYYLRENLRTIRAVLDYRDDRRTPPAQLYNGSVAPVWGTAYYSEGNGRRYAVGHSGMLTYPMLDFLKLVEGAPAVRAQIPEYADMITTIAQTLDWHNREWVNGPVAGEGYYIMHPDSEHRAQYQNQTMPFNLQSAMGRALWASWKLTGNEAHRDKALALGRYIKNRILILATDGAYYWEYWIYEGHAAPGSAKQNINSEDISHAMLSVQFPIVLARDGEVFDRVDMERFGKTVTQGFARLGNGIMFGEVNGSPLRFDTISEIQGSVGGLYGWLHLTPWVPEVYGRIAEFYVKYRAAWDNHIDDATLRLYREWPRSGARGGGAYR